MCAATRKDGDVSSPECNAAPVADIEQTRAAGDDMKRCPALRLRFVLG
jgi:hypothetical protein